MRNKIQLSLFLTLLIFGVQGKFAAVFANPTVDFSYAGYCVGSPTQFNVDYVLPDINDISSWDWNFGDGKFSNEKNPHYTYAGPGTYTVVLTITDIFGKIGTKSHTITIQNLPVPSFFYDTPNCASDSIKFTDLSTTPDGYIKQWKWDFNDGSPVKIILLPDSPNPKHLFPTDGIFNVSLTVMNSVNSCENTISLPVTITPGPIANFYSDGECEDQIVSFTDASFANGAGNIAFLEWTFGDVTSGINNTSNLINPLHSFNNAGTYIVSLKIRNFNGCTDSIAKTILINAHPPVEYTNTSPCLGEAVFFNPDPSIINLPSIASYHWDFGDGITSNAENTSHPFSSTGNYLVTLEVTDILGCRNEVTHTIKVNPLPVAQFSTNLSYCAGAKVEFQDLSSTAAGYISSWEWDFGDGSNKIVINQPGSPDSSHVYALAGSYYVTLKIKSSTGCSGTTTKLLIIHSNPLANFTFTKGCTGTPVEFTDNTQLNGALPIMQWQWDFGDPGSGISNFSPLQDPEHAFVATGNSIVKLIVTNGNGCVDSIKQTIQVNPAPPVNFLTNQNCQNKAVTFIPDASVMNIAAIASWYWDFGSGFISPQQNPTHIFATAGVQNVSLTVVDTSGCANTISKPIVIASEPVVNFSFQQPACTQTSVKFDNFSNVPGGFIVKSEWDFGDGIIQPTNTLVSVYHTYTSYGTFTVSLKITSNDGCEKTLALPIVIFPKPIADFSVSATCLGSAAQFTDLSQAVAGGITGWSWNFGDPTSGINNVLSVKQPAHIYNTSGTFPVQLIVSNSGGCLDTAVKQVLVHGVPAVDFTSSPGCANGLTHFTCSTFVNAGAISSYFWSFGDGHTSQSIDPSNIYANSGSYIITLTVTDTAGCTSSKVHTVVIAQPPSALFDISVQSCSGSPVLFSVLPATGSPVTTYIWEFGDGKDTLINAPASGNVSHVYSSGNNYSVVLTVKTALGCEAKSQRIVSISPGPIAKFSYDNFCTGAAVNFSDFSDINSGTSIVSWLWDFNDPSSTTNNTSGLRNPSHVFNTAGTYLVSLKVGNLSGCFNTITKSVVINPKPAADFDWSGSCVGSTKFTINTSITNTSAIASYNWDFGDGTAHDITQNPVHNYTITGNHTVILTIVSITGCKNSVSKTIEIVPQPSAFFSSNSSCLGTSTEFTDQSFSSGGVPITAWHWDFGVNATLNDTSNQQNPVFNYKTFGVYEVKLTVTTQNGCQNSITLPSQVFGNPTANFTYTVSPCGKGAVYFQDSSYNKQAPIVSYDWEFESNHNNLQDPVHVFYSVDSCYNIRLIAKDVRGCVDTIVKEVCVPAEFDFSFAATNNCLFDSTQFSPLSVGNSTGTLVSFYWNFGDAKSGANNNSTKKFPSHYYDQPGTYTVSLSAIDIYNCSKLVSRNITILPPPESYFTFTEGACDSTIYFNETSYSTGSDINRWTWEYGDGVIKSIVAPDSPDLSHHYAVPGLYTASLTVTNSVGCTSKSTITDIQVKPCLAAALELYDTLICQNNILTFIDNSNTSNSTNEWYWDFGDGTHTQYSSFTNHITHKYVSSGNFRVLLVLSTDVDGRKISDTAKLSVNINPTPLPDFNSGVVCHEQNAVFTNMTSGNGTKIISYNWNFGEPLSDPQDTSTLKNPVHLYNSPGTYDVILVVKNSIGCTDSIQKPLVVHGLPEANYTYSVSCAGNTTSFKDLSVAAVAPLANWDWTCFNEKGVTGKLAIQNPGFVFAEPGNYRVNLMVTDVFGCMDTINQNVTTWSVPTSLFDYKENYDNVQGQLQFTNNSMDATKYYWDFGNGTDSYSENPVANYENDGNYTITLISSNDKDCTDTLSSNYAFMVKGLFIPNAFSPENLKLEVQLLKPIGINLLEYSFEVFDRWGNLIWKTDKLDAEGRPVEGWDGKLNGVVMPEGAYPWKASGLFKDGSIWEAVNVGNTDHMPNSKVGTATLIR